MHLMSQSLVSVDDTGTERMQNGEQSSHMPTLVSWSLGLYANHISSYICEHYDMLIEGSLHVFVLIQLIVAGIVNI